MFKLKKLIGSCETGREILFFWWESGRIPVCPPSTRLTLDWNYYSKLEITDWGVAVTVEIPVQGKVLQLQREES